MATRKARTGGKKDATLPPRETLLWMYLTMRRIRRFEETAEQLFKAARMRGTVHFYIGEEATAAGVCALLRRQDYITSTHRGHGHCIAKGGELSKMMAELLGRVTGYCGGKGGSMHIADIELGILGANGIVGAGMPIAVGAALGSRIRGEDKVTVCFFGDGAGPTGAFHESVNFAALQKLPVVFVCENNQYGMSTTTEMSNAGPGIGARGTMYGIPGVVVDGNDVFAVFEVAREAVARAKSGEGPTLIESKTYRMKGHTVNDLATYRSEDEVKEWAAKDPILRFVARVTQDGALKQEDLDGLDAQIEKEIADAVEFGEASPFPLLEAIEQGVYAD